MGFIEAVSGQLYYPVEHLAWAADYGLISLNSTHLWTVAIILWIVPLLINITKLLRHIICCKTTPTLPQQQRVHTMLKMVRYLCDLSLAIYWLPRGCLWGGLLPASIWGLLGTVSSLINIYTIYAASHSHVTPTHSQS